ARPGCRGPRRRHPAPAPPPARGSRPPGRGRAAWAPPPAPPAAPAAPAAVAAVAPPAVAPATYADALAQGKAAEASGDHAQARQLLEAAAKLDRKAAEPHLELARVFIATGEARPPGPPPPQPRRAQGGQAGAGVERRLQHARPRRARPVQLRRRDRRVRPCRRAQPRQRVGVE